MNALARIRLAASVASPERDFEPARVPGADAHYAFLSEHRLWPGCGFLTLYVATERVALAQPLLALN